VETLKRNADCYFGSRGRAWIRELPEILGRVSAMWTLEIGPHFAELSVNYVAPATRADGTRCVLKVGVPDEGIQAEIGSPRQRWRLRPRRVFA
jgi:streptomycin 6-kinase